MMYSEKGQLARGENRDGDNETATDYKKPLNKTVTIIPYTDPRTRQFQTQTKDLISRHSRRASFVGKR